MEESSYYSESPSQSPELESQIPDPDPDPDLFSITEPLQFTICNWYGNMYIKNAGIVSKRCTSKCFHESAYCEKHSSLRHDFKPISKKLCNSYQSIIITPKTYTQIESTLESLNYRITDKQCVIKPHDTYADLSESDKITLDNEEVYYYNTPKKSECTTAIRLSLKKYCNGASVVSANGMIFCRNCYEKVVAHKIGGPTISTITDSDALDNTLREMILAGTYQGPGKKTPKPKTEKEDLPKSCCTGTTKKGQPCSRYAVIEGMCKAHYTSANA